MDPKHSTALEFWDDTLAVYLNNLFDWMALLDFFETKYRLAM